MWPRSYRATRWRRTASRPALHGDDVGKEVGVKRADTVVVDDLPPRRLHARLRGGFVGLGRSSGVLPDDAHLLHRLRVLAGEILEEVEWIIVDGIGNRAVEVGVGHQPRVERD